MHYLLISDDDLTVHAGDVPGVVMEPATGYGSGESPTDQRYLDLRSDACFRYVVGKVANKDLLLDFVNSVFEDRKPLRGLRFGPTERVGETVQSREARFDLFFTGDNGDQFLLEMQRRRRSLEKMPASGPTTCAGLVPGNPSRRNSSCALLNCESSSKEKTN